MAVQPVVVSPNPIAVAWSILRSLRRIDPPRPSGTGTFDHAILGSALEVLAEGQTPVLSAIDDALAQYLEKAASIDPDTLSRDYAKAFWINVYNAGALRLAAAAQASGHDSVLRVPGGFQDRFVTIGGVELSLDDVEHAKVRRFEDPRIHGALVCGSVSCPTLRAVPYTGVGLDAQLDHQMRFFLANGGAVADVASGTIHLSRVFGWFGSDFVKPARMPTFIPSPRSRVVEVLRPWLEGDVARLAAGRHRVEYQAYDWGLRCAVV